MSDEQRTLRDSVAGAFVFVAGVVAAFQATTAGTNLVYDRLTDPGWFSVLLPAEVTLVILLCLGSAVITVLVGLGVVEAVAEPSLCGYMEYTLVGSGGLIGTLSAAAISGSIWLMGWGSRIVSIPNSGSPSFAALLVVAAPIGYVFYYLYTPDESIEPSHKDREILDPEYVRENTVRKSSTTRPRPERQTQIREDETTASESDREDRPQNDRVTQPADDAGGENSTGSDGRQFRWISDSGVSFDDVGGMTELKRELRRDVIMPLTTRREEAEKLGVTPPNIIFHGPPGTGKTYIAKALATELEVPLAQLSGADLQSKWINESATKVKTLFDEAREVAAQNGGAVVFLDELDSVLKDRSGGANSHDEDTKVVNEFLNTLEETGDHNVVFIGATNRLESLDGAGIRSGRIDKKIHIGMPDREARRAILNAQLNDRPNVLTGEQLEEIAEQTEGMTAADLESLVEDAARVSLYDRGDDEITYHDVQSALPD